MHDNNTASTMPPPYEDGDCNRALTLDDYTQGFMVRTRERGRQSTWRATFSDLEAALREVRDCVDEQYLDGCRRYVEVAVWQDGKPLEIWRYGRPKMGSGVTA
jgi:hypothetical protein